MIATTYWIILGIIVLVPGLISVFFKGFSFDPRQWRRLAPVSVHKRRHDDRHQIM